MEVILGIVGVLIAGVALLFGDGLLRRNRAERHVRKLEQLKLRPGEHVEWEEIDPGLITIYVTIVVCIAAAFIVHTIYGDRDPPSHIVADNAADAGYKKTPAN